MRLRTNAFCLCLTALCAFFATLSLALAQSPDPALRGHGGPIRSIAVLDAQTVVTGGFDAAIIVWDLASGTAKHVLRIHDGAVTALVSYDGANGGCFLSGGDDGKIAEWCRGETEARRSWQAHSGPITAFALPETRTAGPTRRLPISASWDRTAKFTPDAFPEGFSWTGTSPIVEHKSPLNGIAIVTGYGDPDALISASYDGEVRITRLADQRRLRQLQLPAALNGLAMLPDGGIVLTAADGRVRVLDPDLTVRFEIELPDGPLTAVAVSPDGRTIAVAGMRTPATLIDVAARAVARRILGPGLPIWALAFSVDSRELFTGGADRALRRWTVATGEPVGAALSPAADFPSNTVSGPGPGARVFRACAVCHAVKPEDVQRAGPSLAGIMGRRIATAPGYAYSEALKTLDIVWTPETIGKLFEIGPTLYTPGTKMPEQRLTDPADRRALTDWLATVTKP